MILLKMSRFFYISLLVTVITGCGGGSDVVISSEQDGSDLPIPQMIRSLASTGKGELKAYVKINGGGRQLMMIDAKSQTFSLTIKGLSSGLHKFSIEFLFESTVYGEVVVATASQSVTLSEGSASTLGFEEQAYDTESHDDDRDNISNLLELEADTYFRSEVPVIEITVPQNVAVEALNQNIRLNWSVVEGASSYNIYMAEQSGVKKDNYQTLPGGMKYNVEASDTTFIHPVPLVNGANYYFVVTAVDSDSIEGSESVQIQGTPIAPLVEPPADLSPDPFSFSDQTEVSPNTTVTSVPITVNGITAATEISIIGGAYSINGGSYVSTAGSVESGDKVTVRLISSSGYSSAKIVTLTIGDVTDTFSVTTEDTPNISARAILNGPVVDAWVKIYSVERITGDPIYSTKTQDNLSDFSTAGSFIVPTTIVSDDQLYIVDVMGGQDIDVNQSGIRNSHPSNVSGNFHALMTGAEMKKGDWLVNPLSEIAYQQAKYVLSAQYESSVVLAKLDQSASRQLKSDITNDGTINHHDLYHFSPRMNNGMWQARQSISLDQVLSAIYNGGDVLSMSMSLDSDIVSTIETGGLVRNIALSGNYVYAANGVNGGLAVLDISNPGSPILVSTVDTLGDAQDVRVDGNYAYVVDASLGFEYVTSGGVTIVDISNPVSPVVVKMLEVGLDDVYSISLNGNYAYLSAGFYGLIILDISNPISTTVVNTIETDGVVRNIALSGNYAYVANGVDGGLAVLDISNPGSPILVASVDTLGDAHYVSISGNYAYVADGYSGLTIIDISNPVTPKALSTTKTLGYASDITLNESYAYVVNSGAGVTVLDISNPVRPVVVRNMHTASIRNPYSIALNGNYAYVADGPAGLTVLNISNPDSLSIVNTIETLGNAEDIIQNEGYAYIADGQAGLTVLDISNPPNFGISVTASGRGASSIALNNSYAYIVDYTSAITVMDISNPLKQVVLRFVSTPGISKDIVVSESYAYVADGYAGLTVLNISNPVSPTVVSTVDTQGDAKSIAVNGNYVYVGDYSGGLTILDISSPASPIMMSRVDKPSPLGIADTIYDIVINGSYLYAASEEAGLEVFDISNPVSPAFVSTVNTLGLSAYGVTLSGDYAYVADGLAGVMLMDIREPSSPKLVAFLDTPGISNSVTLRGGYAFVADGSTGLSIFKTPQIDLDSLP